MPLLSGLSTGVKQGSRLEVQGCSDLEGAIGSEDRTVVRQPLDPVRCPEVAKPLLNTLHHHVPDHFAGVRLAQFVAEA
jgi:hypothetical protein